MAGELLDAAVDVARLSPIGAEALLGVRGPTRSGRGDHAYNFAIDAHPYYEAAGRSMAFVPLPTGARAT